MGTGCNRGFLVTAGLPILYPLSEWVQYRIPPLDLGLEFSVPMKDLLFYSTSVLYVTLVFLMFLFLLRENARSEEEFETALMKVESEKQRARSFSSSKFAAHGEMASGIAHEIDNPMMVININTEHLKSLLKEPDLEKHLILKRIEVISSTVARVARIIDSMRWNR